MKISCGWNYAISKYGYPPSMGDIYRAIEGMAGMGFKDIELEGIGEKNLGWKEGKKAEKVGI